jgi:hypothetical protein
MLQVFVGLPVGYRNIDSRVERSVHDALLHGTCMYVQVTCAHMVKLGLANLRLATVVTPMQAAPLYRWGGQVTGMIVAAVAVRLVL